MINADDILIIADKAEFKAFKVTSTVLGTKDIKMIENISYIDPHKKISSLLSDKVGNQGHNNGDNKYMKREMFRKSLDMILSSTKRVLSTNLNSSWHISAPSSMLNSIISNLDNNIYRSLGLILHKDLINTKKTKLLSHFE
ncbi:MAG: host attachment protein [Campylobacteraceae bacterium]|nr:host attachment protein [Campylobacteraceae bacterium]